MLGVVLYKFEKEATGPFQDMNIVRGDIYTEFGKYRDLHYTCISLALMLVFSPRSVGV